MLLAWLRTLLRSWRKNGSNKPPKDVIDRGQWEIDEELMRQDDQVNDAARRDLEAVLDGEINVCTAKLKEAARLMAHRQFGPQHPQLLGDVVHIGEVWISYWGTAIVYKDGEPHRVMVNGLHYRQLLAIHTGVIHIAGEATWVIQNADEWEPAAMS